MVQNFGVFMTEKCGDCFLTQCTQTVFARLNFFNWQGHMVKDLTKDLEKKLADREVKKPLGGVNVLPDNSNIVQELKSSKTDEDDDDDWDISSLEDKSPAPKLQEIPVKKSFDSSNTSVWGSSTGKTHKGQNDVDAPSTMKSSIVTVSDWSVSDAM